MGNELPPTWVVIGGIASWAVVHSTGGPAHRMWMPAPPGRCLRCQPVDQTPIYEQLRGERLNAEVPAGTRHPQQHEHPGRHRRSTDTAPTAAVFGPSGPGSARAASRPPEGLPVASSEKPSIYIVCAGERLDRHRPCGVRESQLQHRDLHKREDRW
jgi:hypothetical protein